MPNLSAYIYTGTAALFQWGLLFAFGGRIVSSYGYFPGPTLKKLDSWIEQSQTIRANYGVVWRIRLTPEQKSIFTRLNNRKKLYSELDFIVAGYECVMLNYKFTAVMDADKWCAENLGPKRYGRHAHLFFFLNKNDATLFKMSCM